MPDVMMPHFPFATSDEMMFILYFAISAPLTFTFSGLNSKHDAQSCVDDVVNIGATLYFFLDSLALSTTVLRPSPCAYHTAGTNFFATPNTRYFNT